MGHVEKLRSWGIRVSVFVVCMVWLAGCSGGDTTAVESTTIPDETTTAPAEQVAAPATTTTSVEPTASVEKATEFWNAVASGDREAAVAVVDPAALEADHVNTFGRAHYLEGQFDWYEAVGWQWTLDSCVEIDARSVECIAHARNVWSDALGIEPVEGAFVLVFAEDGISQIADQGVPFIERWGPVFGTFANWVEANHPDDADVMFNFSVDVNDEILDLYRVNTERFAEAQGEGQSTSELLITNGGLARVQ